MRKPTKWHVRPSKTQTSMGIRPVLSESSLPAWRNIRSSDTHWAHCEDSDKTGRMPRLIWVFAGRTVIVLVLSRGGSIIIFFMFHILQSPEEGAQTLIYCAVSDEVKGQSGKYYVDCREADDQSSEMSKDMGLAKKLWEVSERMTGLVENTDQ